MTQIGDYRFFVGRRSDPFFFDVQGTLNNFQFTGEDFFADKDICSIVLESTQLCSGAERGWPMGPHAHSGKTARAGGWVQADRGARAQPNSLPCRRAK